MHKNAQDPQVINEVKGLCPTHARVRQSGWSRGESAHLQRKVHRAAPSDAQNIIGGIFDSNRHIKHVSNTSSDQNKRTKRDSDKGAEMCP